MLIKMHIRHLQKVLHYISRIHTSKINLKILINDNYLLLLTCQYSVNGSNTNDIRGDSPGSRNASRYIRSASSTRVPHKSKELNKKQQIIKYTLKL